MSESLFPIGEYWSWTTFFLYFAVAVWVTGCCKKGAICSAAAKRCEANNHRKISLIWTSKSYYFFAFLVLALLATIRTADVGPDTKVYVGYFETPRFLSYDWSALSNFQQMEPGFQLFLWLSQRITKDYHIFFLIAYSFIAWTYIRYIKHFFSESSNYTFLQLFIFFYVANMSGMRAALGTGFLLLSYIQIEKDRNIRAAILTLLACMFHYTMIYNFYIIVATSIYRKPALRQKKWLWVVMLIAVTVFGSTGVILLKNLFMGTKYGYYSRVDISAQSLLGSVFYLFYALICLLFYRHIMKSNVKIQGQFISTLCFLVTYPVIYIIAAYRIPNYYALPRLVVWSEAANYIVKSSKTANQRLLYKIVLQIIIILYLLFRFTRSAESGSFVYTIGW